MQSIWINSEDGFEVQETSPDIYIVDIEAPQRTQVILNEEAAIALVQRLAPAIALNYRKRKEADAMMREGA